MALTKLTADMNNVQGLPDKPTMQKTLVKQTMDKGCNDTKTYINDTLTPEIDTEISSVNTALTTHKTSADHDGRYYTKTEIDPFLRGGDTVIKVEVFTILNSNLGDGTFSYTNKDGQAVIGTLDVDGGQIFALTEGTYPVNENKIDATINDSLHRDTASGGLTEIDEAHIKLIQPEGAGAEITFKYFEKVGLMGEHAVSHEVGGGDEIQGICHVGITQPTKAIWFKVV